MFQTMYFRKLNIFNGGCPGQNKNNILLRFCLALIDTERFDGIVHYFLSEEIPFSQMIGILKQLKEKSKNMIESI